MNFSQQKFPYWHQIQLRPLAMNHMIQDDEVISSLAKCAKVELVINSQHSTLLENNNFYNNFYNTLMIF